VRLRMDGGRSRKLFDKAQLRGKNQAFCSSTSQNLHRSRTFSSDTADFYISPLTAFLLDNDIPGST
jgi:hypothetical protein